MRSGPDRARRYVVTGGLGTGKTSVISALAGEVETVAEPARELIAEHRAATGETTLDDRPETFVTRLIERSVENYGSISQGIAVFDRGLPDCAAYAAVYGLDTRPALEASGRYRYDSPVFVAPPWEEIYTTDDMRRATFDEAKAFHAAVVAAYERSGYEMVELPRATVEARVDFMNALLA